MSNDNQELTQEEKELVELANMSLEMPENLSDNHGRIWRAFHIGRNQLRTQLAELKDRLQFLVNDLAPDVDNEWEAYDKAVELLATLNESEKK